MDSGSQWVAKLGPLERQNSAATRSQAEAGAHRLVLEAATAILAKVAELGPEFLKGLNAPTGSAEPELVQEAPEVELHSYQLPNGHWFTLATTDSFGLKVVSKKA